MAKRKKNGNVEGAGVADTEFGAEVGMSKKARKKAARENRKK